MISQVTLIERFNCEWQSPQQLETEIFFSTTIPLWTACTVGHKSHDPCFHKKYIEAGFMTFVAHFTIASPKYV